MSQKINDEVVDVLFDGIRKHIPALDSLDDKGLYEYKSDMVMRFFRKHSEGITPGLDDILEAIAVELVYAYHANQKGDKDAGDNTGASDLIGPDGQPVADVQDTPPAGTTILDQEG